MNGQRKSRQIVDRIVVCGELVLSTPARFGNGEEDPYVDLPISRDAYDGRPVILGTSLAGALRNALRDRLEGYRTPVNDPDSLVIHLFGGRRGEPAERQSALIVEDALATERLPEIELRDGVGIDPESGAAAQSLKYDLELLPAGTRFNLGFELLATEEESKALRAALAAVLQMLAQGDVPLGARKRRGFGECRVENWQVWRYELLTPDGLRASLAHDHPDWEAHRDPDVGNDIEALLDAVGALEGLPDRRTFFELRGRFALPDGLLIRSGFESLEGPDVMQLRSFRPGEADEPAVISGTSLAGVVRGRALKIARTLNPEGQAPERLVRDVFGFGPAGDSDEEGQASRLEVFEKTIESTAVLSVGDVQQRVRIDRWTGGALDTGLFAEAPLGCGEVELELRLRNPQPAEIALLLHVWKDLWSGDLPLGGEGSVGRGRLVGLGGSLRWRNETGDREWPLAANGALQASEQDRQRFANCQAALIGVLNHGRD